MGFVLNLPWNLVGLLVALVSIPVHVRTVQGAVVFNIRSWWWTKMFPYMKGVRAVTICYIVLLGPNVEPLDLDHELVHVEQHKRHPFIQPFLYTWELVRKGYRENRFEEEAYRRAGNVYKGK
jgi:hypothetical protein